MHWISYFGDARHPGSSLGYAGAYWALDQPTARSLTTSNAWGSGRLNLKYRYPILQSYDGETSYPADLLVRMPNGRKTIKASEMRTLLRCIYFKHYLRWDRPFLDEG